MTPAEALMALEDCCRELWDQVEAAQARTDPAGLLSHLFSGHSYRPGLDAALAAYSPRVEGAVAELRASLAGLPPEAAEALALRALELLLFYPRPGQLSQELVLVALEGKGEALLPCLGREARGELARRYRERTPPRRMLPNQKRLWKALSQDT